MKDREPMNAERCVDSERLALTRRRYERRPSGPKYFLGACGATGCYRNGLCWDCREGKLLAVLSKTVTPHNKCLAAHNA